MGVKWPQREADNSLPLIGAHNYMDSFALSSWTPTYSDEYNGFYSYYQ